MNFISGLEKAYGVVPIIYAREDFYLKYLKEALDSNWEDYHFWVGEVEKPYSAYDFYPSIYQAEIRNVKGVKGKVDFNELHRPLQQFLLSPLQ